MARLLRWLPLGKLRSDLADAVELSGEIGRFVTLSVSDAREVAKAYAQLDRMAARQATRRLEELARAAHAFVERFESAA